MKQQRHAKEEAFFRFHSQDLAPPRRLEYNPSQPTARLKLVSFWFL
jgi:hypothetical protein